MTSELKREARRSDGMRRIVRTLFEWPWTALGFFVVFFGFLLLIAYVFPPLYEVRALVLVKSGAEKSPLVYLPIARAPIGNLSTSQEDVNSEVAILTSRPVVEEVVDRRLALNEVEEPATGARLAIENFQSWCRDVGLLPVIDDRETTILALQNNISVEPMPVSNVIEITYLSFSPKNAARTINFLLDAYLRRHGETHRNPEALEFFQREAETIRLRLASVQHELTQFRVDNEGGDLTLKRSLLLERLVTTQQNRRTLENVAEGEEELLSDAALLENRELSFNREKLLDLKLELAKQQQLYAENSTQIQGLRSQIAIARSALADQITRLKLSLAHDEEKLNAQLQDVELQRAKFLQLEDEEKRLQQNFDTYTAKAEEERVSQAMGAGQMVSARILERATVPVKPYFPNRLMLAILGILFGVPGAIAATLLKGYLYGRVASVEDVEEELGIPVIASIRRLPGRLGMLNATGAIALVVIFVVASYALGNAPAVKRTIQYAVIGIFLLSILPAVIEIWRARRERGRWSFGKEMPVDVVNAARAIQSTLAASQTSDTERAVYFASATRREGAATLARAVAEIAAAESGGKTVFVDLGRKPDGARTKATELPRAPEAAFALAKRSPDAPGLDTIDLSRSRLVALGPLLDGLREHYDHVFVAGPPLTGRSDGASYVSLADRAVLVISGSGVHLEVARRALSLLRQHSRDVVGAVLTQRREAVPALIYRWM